jgi:hypothetical protein
VSTLEALTLVIAAAGVAAAAGAIWTGLETRRYAGDTAKLLQSSREALAEQTRNWRLELQMSIFLRIVERWDSAEMRRQRAALALRWDGWLMLAEEKRLGRPASASDFSRQLSGPDEAVFDFFETLGLLLRLEYLDRELAWHTFSDAAGHWWGLSHAYIEKLREAGTDPTVYEDFKAFALALQQEDARRRKTSLADVQPTEKDLDDFLQKEKRL